MITLMVMIILGILAIGIVFGVLMFGIGISGKVGKS